MMHIRTSVLYYFLTFFYIIPRTYDKISVNKYGDDLIMKELFTTDHMGLNPILPLYEYIPDGEPHVFGERIYLFGSHDKFNGNTFCMNDYVAYSASIYDLTEWKFEGYTFHRHQDPRYKDADKDFLYAPDVVKGKDGRYYLYYCLNPYPEIGVAVCNEPAGQYEFYGLVKYSNGEILGQKNGDWSQFDPAIFIDDDGRIYLYSGNCPRRKGTGITNRASQVMELEDDMLTLKTAPKRLLCSIDDSENTGFEGHEFFEASSIRKIGDLYYLIYSSLQCNELCYAYSKSPDRDFKYGGVIISNTDIFEEKNGNKIAMNRNGNNHGSIECINNQWYVFYHRQTHVNSYSRQACAEKLYINADGAIPQVEITTTGLSSSVVKTKDWISAGRACNLVCDFRSEAASDKPKYPFISQTGEDRENNPDLFITGITDNSLVGFKYFDCDNLKSVTICIRGDFNGTIDVLDNLNGEAKGTLSVNLDNNQTEYKEYTIEVGGIHGSSAIYFYTKGSGMLQFSKFRLNY